ncbi:MAG: MoxR family ATPase [Candidatus Heimdallarchaeota archaeon]|nr:MoxR family ATPase [Candidatus Heimdallarchaeota archaeon]
MAIDTALPVLGIRQTKMILSQIMDNINQEGTQGIFLWGPPGIGKSALVRQLAEEHDMELRDVRLPLLDPVDLRGLPMVDKEEGVARWLPPDFLPRSNLKKPGILLLDEINAAPPSIQASAYQLILDRRIGSYVLPDRWIVIAAGNRVSDRAVAFKLPSALANRFTHLEISPDADEWVQWALSEDIDPLIIAFIKSQPSMLFQFDPQRLPIAFPSPRSWTFASNLQDLRTHDILLYLSALQGTIGNAAKEQFRTFIEYEKDVPNVEDILEGRAYDPPSPNQLDILYIIFANIIASLLKNMSENRVENFFSYAMQYDNTMAADYSVLLLKELIEQAKIKGNVYQIMKVKSYSKWLVNNKDINN